MINISSYPQFALIIYACFAWILSGCAGTTDAPKEEEPPAPTAPSFSIQVQFEDYAAYYDLDEGNTGNEYRNNDVDIKAVATNAYAVTDFQEGEWLDYAINLPEKGHYLLKLYYSTPSDSSAIGLTYNGIGLGGEYRLEQTSSQIPWASGTLLLGELPAGPGILRFFSTKKSSELTAFDWFELQKTERTKPAKEIPLPALFPVGDAQSGNGIYSAQCQGCHGANGEGNVNINAPSLQGCPTCDNIQVMANYVAATMPTANPDLCIDQCAVDVSTYIVEQWNSAKGAIAQCNLQQPAPSISPLKRLSKTEYMHTLSALLQSPDIDFSEVPEESSNNNFNTIGDAQIVSSNQLRAYLNIAEKNAAEIINNDTKRSAIVNCDINQPTCLNQFIESFGYLAFRRPIEDIERNAIADFAKEKAISNEQVFTRALKAILTSPKFLYRIETGGDWVKCTNASHEQCQFNGTQRVRYGLNDIWVEGIFTDGVKCSPSEFGGDPAFGDAKHCEVSPLQGALPLNKFELVSRLSFALWARGPSKDLLDKAKKGELDNSADIRSLIESMLRDDKTQSHIKNFFEQWLALNLLIEPSDTPNQWYPNIIKDMKNETLSLLEEHAWDDKEFFNIFTANYSYITPQLAEAYHVSESTTGKVEFSEGDPRYQTGVLTHAANMFAKTDGDLVSIRGDWLRSTFLCKELEVPSTVQGDLDGKFAGLSSIDIIGARNKDAACSGCHAKIDPIGIAFINYDKFGIFDYSLNPDEYPIYPTFPDKEAHALAGARTMAQHLRTMPEVGHCLSERLFLYMHYREPTVEEYCEIEKVNQAFVNSGYDFSALILALAESSSFSSRTEPSISN